MNVYESFSDLGIALERLGWAVHRRDKPARFPHDIAERYAWLPADAIALLGSFDAVVSPSQKAWLTTFAELCGESDSAFSWNQWEQDSLCAAVGDSDWQESIRTFWYKHFPVLVSVKSGYAYIAIRKDLAVVVGEEPEFEETQTLAADFATFLRLLAEGNNRLDRWI